MDCYVDVYCLRSAFFAEIPSDSDDVKSRKKKPMVGDQETSAERTLRERQRGINGLFDAIGLRPSLASSVFRNQKAKGKIDSTRAMLEGTDWKAKPSKAKSTGDDEEEGEELNENQLDLVYQKATMHDKDLAQMDPPKGFKLKLRKYQKQGLGWMVKMEEGGDARDEMSMHPLWEECVSPWFQKNAVLTGLSSAGTSSRLKMANYWWTMSDSVRIDKIPRKHFAC